MSPSRLPGNPPCHSCKAPFDAQTADWCRCIARFRSLCCPACLRCFCQAPRSYRNRFWASAPEEVQDRRRAEHLVGRVPIPSPDPSSLARPLVLVVESETRVRRFAVSAVISFGYGVAQAGRGDEALELVRSCAPDLVLARALLPKLDGRLLCRAIKDDTSTSRIPVVIMTPLYTAPRYRYEAFRKFGVDEYLTMPLPLATLREVLETRLLGARAS